MRAVFMAMCRRGSCAPLPCAIASRPEVHVCAIVRSCGLEVLLRVGALERETAAAAASLEVNALDRSLMTRMHVRSRLVCRPVGYSSRMVWMLVTVKCSAWLGRRVRISVVPVRCCTQRRHASIGLCWLAHRSFVIAHRPLRCSHVLAGCSSRP